MSRSVLSALRSRIKQGKTQGICSACSLRNLNDPDYQAKRAEDNKECQEKKLAESYDWARRVWFEATRGIEG